MKGYFVCLGGFYSQAMALEIHLSYNEIWKHMWGKEGGWPQGLLIFYIFVLNLDSWCCRWINFVMPKIYLAYCVIVRLDFF